MMLPEPSPIREIASPDRTRLQELAEAGEPVVLRGIASDWPVVAAARQSSGAVSTYLKARDRGASVPVMEAPAAYRGRFGYGPDLREFSFTRRQRPLPETLDRIERTAALADGPVIAIQMLRLDAALPDVVRDNPMPLLPDVSPLLWLGGPVRTQIHNDRDHNLACVVAGRRRFMLFPPDQVANLYIGPADNPPPLSLVDPEAPDLTRFPRYADALATAQVAELAPGDALLMPRHWWHHVASLDRYNVMINYWWGARPAGLENPHDAFLVALLALKSLPEAERRYWRAMFDAHVFAKDEAAVAHLPSALRGRLGPLQPNDRAAIKQQLRAMVLKTP